MSVSSGSVLIVGDDEMVRGALIHLLEHNGYKVEVADDDRQARQQVLLRAFDVVLLDLESRDTPGLDILRSFRENNPQGHLPIIVIAAESRSLVIDEALKLGAVECVTMPFDFPLVLARIQLQISHKRSVDELMNQRALLEFQVEASDDGSLLVAASGEWLSFNRRFIEMWQIPEQLILSRSKRDALDSMLDKVADPNQFKNVIACLNSQVNERGCDETVLKDGRTFECSSTPIITKEGNYIGRVWHYHDVTRRKWAEEAQLEAERALRESEERYALAARGANDGLWDWNLKTNKLYYSPRWKSMLGYEETEIGESPEEWLKRVHPEDIQRVRDDISSHLEGRTPHYESEHRLFHKSGTYRWMLNRGLAVRDAQGKAVRMAGSQTDITQSKVVDPLTGMANRLLFMDRLGRLLDQSKRRKNYLFAVLFLDLDRFKVINDSLGHLVGDQLLIAIARRLEACLRSSDIIARFDEKHTMARLGGDEFMILLDDIKHVGDVTGVADRIQKELTLPFDLNGQQLFVTASIGIALSATGYEKPEHLLRDAETAMYSAKALGKARYELFDSTMRAQAKARLELETDLRKAIENGEFRNFYQPIISLSSGRIAGFEALVRWQHPDRGLISPGEFIPIAEETALILSVGRLVLLEAARQMQAWRAKFPHESCLAVSVNLSSKQFMQLDLSKEINQILRQSGLDPRNLKLEITESLIMENADMAAAMLMQLKALGIQLGIDDFGTGHSSLSYLHRFPIDTLKIDRSFLSRSGAKGENLEIIRAIVALAHNLHLNVIAEGIETADQAIQLKEMGCEFGQGYFFSRPLEAEAAADLIANSPNWESCEV